MQIAQIGALPPETLRCTDSGRLAAMEKGVTHRALSRTGTKRLLHRPKTGRLWNDHHGAVIIETAIVLPLLILLLLGIVSYGGWFMAAHSLQQAANEAARASLAGLDAAERRELVDRTLAHSVIHTGTLEPKLVSVETAQDSGFYTVMLSYDIAQSGLFRHSLIPLPGNTIERAAVVQLNSL